MSGNGQNFFDGGNSWGTVNEGTQTLAAGETLTGTPINDPRPDAMIAAKVAGGSATLYVDMSIDGGITYDTSIPFNIQDGIGEFHTIVKGSRLFRVRLTAGDDDLTSVKVWTELGTFRQPNKGLSAVLHTDDDAASVRPTEFRYETALGRRGGATTWNKFGYNDDVDTAAPEVLAEFGGAFAPLFSASTLTIVSTSSDDDSGSSVGATGIVVYGIDANYLGQTEVVFLDGTTNVVTASTWLGVNRVSVFAAGSARQNVGKITVTATTGGSTQATMPAGEGTSQQCIFHVEAGRTALIDFIKINAARFGSGTEPVVTFKGWVYSSVSNSYYEVFRFRLDTSVQVDYDFTPSQPFVVGEKSSFWLEASTTRNDTAVTGRFSLIEYDTA